MLPAPATRRIPLQVPAVAVDDDHGTVGKDVAIPVTGGGVGPWYLLPAAVWMNPPAFDGRPFVAAEVVKRLPADWMVEPLAVIAEGAGHAVGGGFGGGI